MGLIGNMKHGYTFLTQGHPGFRPDKLTERLKSCGLSRTHALLIKEQIRKWVLANGVLWTISHLKKVKQLYINYMAESGTPPEWIARTRSGLPVGAFSVLVKYPERKIIKVINLYKAFELIEIMKPQVEKFVKAVVSDHDIPEWTYDLVRRGLPRSAKTFCEIGPVRRIQELPKIRPQGYYFHLASGSSRKWNITEATADAFMAIWSGLIPSGSFPQLAQTVDPVAVTGGGVLHPPNNRVCGFLGCTQEPGGKLRVFASPSLVYQCALEPLKKGLENMLRKTPCDYTYDHDAGVLAIQAALKAGRKCHSVDLSNATDRFPFTLQEYWLRQTKVNTQLVDLLRYISQGMYLPNKKMIEAGFPSSLNWRVGQPLGAGPSFSLFALTHHWLVRGICRTLSVDSNCYAMLGDDIVIWDSKVACAYIEVMNLMGCSVAPDKTITSSVLAEFAGEVITASERFVSTKHKAVGQDNIQPYALEFGEHIIKEAEQLPYASKALPALAAVPDVVGGFGWNSGSSLGSRLEVPGAQKVFSEFTKARQDPLPETVPEVEGKKVLTSVGLDPLLWSDPTYGSDQALPGLPESKANWEIRREWIARATDTESGQKPNISVPLPNVSHHRSNRRESGPTWWERVLTILALPVRKR